MKIIINRGFNHLFTKVAVFRNEQEITACPMQEDCCEFEARRGDHIAVFFKSIGALPVAAFVCQGNDETYYISPTMTCRVWELASFKIFPYLSILSLAFQLVIESETYKWFCAGMLVLTALSLLIGPLMWKRMFKLKKL